MFHYHTHAVFRARTKLQFNSQQVTVQESVVVVALETSRISCLRLCNCCAIMNGLRLALCWLHHKVGQMVTISAVWQAKASVQSADWKDEHASGITVCYSTLFIYHDAHTRWSKSFELDWTPHRTWSGQPRKRKNNYELQWHSLVWVHNMISKSRGYNTINLKSYIQQYQKSYESTSIR